MQFVWWRKLADNYKILFEKMNKRSDIRINKNSA